MPVSLGNVAADVTTMLNASGDPRWNSGEIANAVLAADALVCAAIFRNKNNARNQLFYATQAGHVSGAPFGLLGICGAIASISFSLSGGDYIGNMAPVSWDMGEIAYENMQGASLFNVGYKYDAHYFIDGGRAIWHNAAAIADAYASVVDVRVVAPIFTESSACQAPSEYAYIVFVGAMALMVPVEGENAGPQSNWAQQFAQGIAEIAKGEGDVTQPDQRQGAPVQE